MDKPIEGRIGEPVIDSGLASILNKTSGITRMNLGMQDGVNHKCWLQFCVPAKFRGIKLKVFIV